MSVALTQFVLLTVLTLLPTVFNKIDLDLQRFEQTCGTDFIDASNLRVRKYNRTTPVLNGTVIFTRDLDNQYMGGVKLAHSRLGNNQFNEYPVKLPTQEFCKMMNDSYRDYQFIFANHSNFPMVPEEGICPFPMGEYWFDNADIPSSFIPEFLPEGYWRLTVSISGPNANFSASVYARVKTAMPTTG